MQHPVVAWISGFEAAAHQLQAIRTGEDLVGHRVALQHAATLVQNQRRDRQAADGLGVQVAQRFAAINKVVQLRRTAQMRQKTGAQRPFIGREIGFVLGPCHTKTQFAAIRGGNVGAHQVVHVMGPAEHLEVDVLLPLGGRHDVVHGEHMVQRLVGERCAGLRVGHVADIAGAFYVARENHHPGIGLFGHTQDQGSEVGIVEFEKAFKGAGHQFRVQCAFIDFTHEFVVTRQFQTKTHQTFMGQDATLHSLLLARVRTHSFPYYFYNFGLGELWAPPLNAACSVASCGATGISVTIAY